MFESSGSMGAVTFNGKYPIEAYQEHQLKWQKMQERKRRLKELEDKAAKEDSGIMDQAELYGFRISNIIDDLSDIQPTTIFYDV